MPEFRHITARWSQQLGCEKRNSENPGCSRPFQMKRLLASAWLAAIAALSCGADALAQQRAHYETLVATHAQANGVPEALVHRVIVRESRYQPALVGRGGTIGLMQIKLATARSLGYTGTAEGLRDPETNLIYGIKYLAGAYHAAGSDHSRAMHYYASGYYYAAKRQRHERARGSEPVLAGAPRNSPVDANAQQVPTQ
jgi:soluble lytic murein transglycosylase-like protein